MLAARSNKKNLTRVDVELILAAIRKKIPVGFKWHTHPVASLPARDTDLPVVNSEFVRAEKQLGTLGGGNHFIEIQRAQDGFVWFMIHSGSRNLGKKIADHYNGVAKRLNARWFSAVPPRWDLAFLPIDEPVARTYLKEMRYAVVFALENRVVMARFVREAFVEVLGNSLSFDDTINIAHNYAAQEHYHGKNPIIHRKGATSARAGRLGIIPGSQGTASYIVEGLGNPKSFNSCSHGAGRKLGRKQAQRTLNIEEEVGRLDEKGILHSIRGEGDLDEAPGAYKNIDEVIANQSDLVKVITRLTPIGVIKG